LIRPAHADDVAALVALEDEAFDVHRISRERFARMLHHATRPVRVLVLDGTLRGYVSVLARCGFPEARLFSIAVARAARGRGAGRTLLSAAEDAAITLECSSMRLEVDPTNVGAVRLYDSAGWRPVRELPDYYGPGRPGLVYRKAIGRW
jgi:ribosomal protein S18 acetylase RimI-like enzyme